MPVNEIPNPKAPKIEVCKFNCDSSLGEHIPPPLPQGHFFMVVTGSAGSGKSTWVNALLCQKNPRLYRKVFHKVYLAMPPNSLHSLSGGPFKKHPKSRLITELTPATLMKVKEDAEESAIEDDHNTLLYIDDFAAYLKDPGVERVLREMIFNRRHSHLSIICALQSMNQLGLPLRKTASHFCMFKPRNKKEGANIFEELIFLDPKLQEELYRYVFQDRHDFLFGDVASGKLYRNFNELEVY